VRRQHRHAPDLRRVAVDAVVPARRDRRAGDADQRVPRIGVGTIVLVDLVVRGDVLLVDKHGKADGKCRFHALAVADIKEFDIHARTSDSSAGVEVRGVFDRIHLCVGLLERNGNILLVANAYPNHSELLWNLPGGRQDRHETCAQTVVREFREETTLDVRVGPLAYVAESFDTNANAQFTAFCFTVASEGDAVVPPGDPHVRALRWVPRAELASILHVGVVREPLLAHLADPAQRYFGYLDAGITIAFGDVPA
jgi:8-oxo-dGTP diphosphatase